MSELSFKKKEGGTSIAAHGSILDISHMVLEAMANSDYIEDLVLSAAHTYLKLKEEGKLHLLQRNRDIEESTVSSGKEEMDCETCVIKDECDEYNDKLRKGDQSAN